MNIVISLIIILWWGRIIHNIISFIQLWWVKEYRPDRMLIHLRTRQGKLIYFLPYKGFHISPKSISLVLFTLFICGMFYIFLPFHPLVNLFVLDIALFPLTAVLVAAFNIPQKIYHALIIEQARRKINASKDLLVIGITGSYGKTSTKEYLSTILSSQYKVLKTEKSQNSLIGISELILRMLTKDHKVFVVEMGAYKIGEIRAMCELVHPEIGILTAINEQHQDLFGSIENTMLAKYELLESLQGRRIAVLGMGHNLEKITSWAKRDGLMIKRPTVTNIKQIEDNLFFEISLDQKKEKVRARVLGEHQAYNISLAITAAVSSGMKLSDAAKKASEITQISKMMKKVTGINGSIFIDDTFNNNPDAAIAAIEYLKTTNGKKYLVFQPMIELGPFTDDAHTRVGRAADSVCDAILLTNENFKEAFMKGIINRQKVKVLNAEDASVFLRERVSANDTVLFKGKEAEKVLNKLL